MASFFIDFICIPPISSDDISLFYYDYRALLSDTHTIAAAAYAAGRKSPVLVYAHATRRKSAEVTNSRAMPTNSEQMKTVCYAIQATFLVLLSILFFSLVGWSLRLSFRPMNHAKMRCNDPKINEPMVSDKGWNMILVALGFFIVSIIIPALGKKKNQRTAFGTTIWCSCGPA